jgi:hypothetical protein
MGETDLERTARLVNRYARKGFRAIDGWLCQGAVDLSMSLHACQCAHGIRGSVCEIGVHHGKLFTLLYLMTAGDEKALAIDLFEQQALNIDHSGRGALKILRRNLRAHAGEIDRLVVLAGDSTKIDAARILSEAGAPIKLFSVDGGHTEEIVAHDMATAAESICPGGIIIADDCFNETWPGVAVGLARFLGRVAGSRVIPFAIGGNKVFLTTADHAAIYREHLESTSIYCEFRIASRFHGHQVLVYQFVPDAWDVFKRTLWCRFKNSAVGRRLRAWRQARRERQA